MNKKLFTILCIAVFLIATVGFISAAEDINNDNDTSDDAIVTSNDNAISNLKNISVKIIWDDASKSSDRPTQVKVKLLKDDVVVDSVVLNEVNSWKDTFKNMDADGNYKVQQDPDPEGYNVSITGDSNIGFVITDKVADDKLGAVENNTALNDTNSSSDVNNATDANATDANNSTVDVNNATDANGTSDNNASDVSNTSGNNASDVNKTADNNNASDVNNTSGNNASDVNKTADDNSTGDANQSDANATNITVINNTNVTNNTDNTNITVNTQNNTVKKNVTPENKTIKKDTPITKLFKTGLPIAILVLVVIIIVVVTVTRKRQ